MTINGVTVKQDGAVSRADATAQVSERMTTGQRFRLGFRKVVGARARKARRPASWSLRFAHTGNVRVASTNVRQLGCEDARARPRRSPDPFDSTSTATASSASGSAFLRKARKAARVRGGGIR